MNSWYKKDLPFRKKVVRENFVSFSRHIIKWLHEVAFRYKERGEFPPILMTLLPSYYTDPQDRELCAFATIPLMSWRIDVVAQAHELRELLGDHPWQWFRDRGFVPLNFTKRRVCGVPTRVYSEFFGILWEEYMYANRLWPKETPGSVLGIYRTLNVLAREYECSYSDAIVRMYEDTDIKTAVYRARLFEMVCGRSDGISLGLWDIDAEDILPPIDENVSKVIRLFFPDYKKQGSQDDAALSFGFDLPSDLFYAGWGYSSMERANPRACGKMINWYHTAYFHGTHYSPCEWRSKFAEIKFD